MKPTLPFAHALVDLVQRCGDEIAAIKEARARMKKRIDDAAADLGIDPAALRRLVAWTEKYMDNNIDVERQDELDEAYRTIMKGGTPIVPKRADTELDQVMALVKNDKPPKIDEVMKAVGCSRGKAHKLRTLVAARLAAKSSSSSKTRELEHLVVGPGTGWVEKKQDELLGSPAGKSTPAVN